MDQLILYKAFLSYLKEDDIPSNTDVYYENKHEANIRYYELQRQSAKDEFIGVYSYAIRIIGPRLKELKRIVFDKEAGGHIEVEDESFSAVFEEYKNHIERAERLYDIIQSLDDDIREEYSKLETEKDGALLAKIKEKKWRQERIFAPSSGKQMELEFKS